MNSVNEVFVPYVELDLVTEYKFNEKEKILTFGIDIIEEEFTVVMKDLGNKKFSFKYQDKEEIVICNKDVEALEGILKKFDDQRLKFIEDSGLVTPTSLSSGLDSQTPLSAMNNQFDFNEKEEIDETFEKLFQDIQAGNKVIKSPHLGAVNFNSYFLIRVAVSVNWMSHWNACAINIDKHRRIVVELEFDVNYLDTSIAPRIAKNGIYQTSDVDLSKPEIKDKKTQFGLLIWYLDNRISTILTQTWSNKSKMNTKKIETISTKESFKLFDPFNLIFKTKQKKNYNDSIDETKIQTLRDMGFSYKVAYYALEDTKEDINLAANALMNETTAKKYETEKDDIFSKTEEMIMNGDTLSTDLFESGNLFIGLYSYLNFKVTNCANNCIICDQELGFEGFKPTICERQLCIHSSEQYGLGVDIMNEINTNAIVVDLLLYLTYTAARMAVTSNGVRELSPQPTSVLELKKKDETKVGTDVMSLLDKMPSIKDIVKNSGGEEKALHSYLLKTEKKLFPLLSWIISSNRSYLIPVPKDKLIGGIPKGIDQFIMVSSNPEREALFSKKKKSQGSFYAFHGSGCGNWHCILRSGLKNYSNTSKMSAGAAAGAGIYLAKNMQTSIGYMHQSDADWKNSTYKSIRCMALCEILQGKGYNSHDWGYVATDENIVITRYLLVFTPEYIGNDQVMVDELKFPKEFYK
eukprot:gene2161-2026_t